MAADFAPFPHHKLVVASRRVPTRKLVFIVEIMTVEAPEDEKRQKDETSALLAYRVALINSAGFTPPTTVANQEERSDRTKRARPTFAAS